MPNFGIHRVLKIATKSPNNPIISVDELRAWLSLNCPEIGWFCPKLCSDSLNLKVRAFVNFKPENKVTLQVNSNLCLPEQSFCQSLQGNY